MSKLEKLLRRFLAQPSDFKWNELLTLLSHLGYEELKTGKTGGSRRKFFDDQKRIINLHKPHPGEILKKYQLKQVFETLKERGQIHDE